MRIKVIKTERDWERANQTEMKRILKKIRELELSEDLNLSIPLRDLKVQFHLSILFMVVSSKNMKNS